MKKFQAIVIILILTGPLAAIGITFATHTATVQWVKPTAPTTTDDPSYPSMPGTPDQYFWNGITPKWIYFTVKNNGPDGISEIKLVFQKYPEGNSMFNFSQTSQSKAGWSATPDEFGPNKRPTVLYFSTNNKFIAQGETVTFGLFMTDGPEECAHNIDVWTVDSGNNPATHFYELWILIDKHAPLFDDNVTPPPGSVFNGALNPTVEVTANATDYGNQTSPAPHVSNIKNMTLTINYSVNSNTTLPNGPPNPIQPPPFIAIMKWDPIRMKYYVVLSSTFGLIDEAWHYCSITFYDYAENGPVTANNITNFFWFLSNDTVIAKTTDPCFLYWKTINGNNGIGHVGGNAVVERNSGFRPNSTIDVTFDTIPPTPIGSGLTDKWGRFILNFRVPMLPFGRYRVVLTPRDNPSEANQTYFYIIPWMAVVGNRSGYVGDQVTVMGTGFDANMLVDVIYRDVSKGLPVYTDPTTEWSDFATRYAWSPHLENQTLSPLLFSTNSSGAFTLTFTIPESYGGWHPVFAQEEINGRRSGWMNNPSTDPASIFPEAAFIKVNTKVWIDRDTTLSGQYVNVYATGLPLPEFHNSTYYCGTGEIITDDHNWTLALDFGPSNASASNKYWVFEKGAILNNEFDYAWFTQLYLPFAYWFNHQDPKSPTWKGTLYWKDAQGEFHTGSQFLKVPVVLPGTYTISLYEFNRQTDKDDQQYLATTSVNVIKDPLYVRASAGTLYFKGENITAYAEIDLDGTATNPTDISFMLYHEDTFKTSLTSKAVAEGLYAATFICPSETGNYFIKVSATKALGGGNALSGFGATSFTVSPTLDGLNATLTAVSNSIATINSTVGTLTLNLNDVKGTVTKIDGNVATIETDIGDIKADVSTIKSQLVTFNNSEATIMTSLGTVTTKLDNIGTQITQISADQVLIKTTVGDIKGNITSVNADTTNIRTSIGELSAKTDSIQAQTGNPASIGLSVIAAVAAIIAAILIFRKLYK
jgi:hypothetical protein